MLSCYLLVIDSKGYLVFGPFSKLKVSKGLMSGLVIGGMLGSAGVAAAIAPRIAVSTNYYACLTNGNLSKVALATQTCKTGQLISWNAQGPQGLVGQTGPQGAKGDTGAVGPAGPQASTFMNFTGQNFSGAWLVNGSFAGALFVNSNLSGANFAGANLTGAYLSGANMLDANFRGANLTGAVLTGGVQGRAGYTAGSANFSDANFTGATVNIYLLNYSTGGKWISFARANFTGATLDASFSANPAVDMTGAICPNGIVYGQSGANC